MIVVHGATGHVGAALVPLLAARGERVRALSRRAPAQPPTDRVQWVRADAERPDSLPAAFEGAASAFVMSPEPIVPGVPPRHVPQLVEAATRAGVRRIVLLSVFSGGEGDDVIAAHWRPIEDAVTGSGLAWTVLRPGRFMSNALSWVPQLARTDELQIPFATRPTASIDPLDIAAVAALALCEDGHCERIHALTGPEALTPVQEVAVLGELLQRPLRAHEPAPEAMRAGMQRAGLAREVIDAVLARTLQAAGEAPLDTVPRLLGRPAGTFAAWARRHLARFQDT